MSLDWLEDSLLSVSRKPRATAQYEWEGIDRKNRKKAINQKLLKDKEVEDASKHIHPVAINARR